MPKFVKEIVRQGEFLVGTADGNRKKKKFQTSDIEHLAETSNKMLQSGLRIPAPRQHTLDAHPSAGEFDPSEGYENLGYWEKFYVGRGADGESALYGVLEAPGDTNDDTTPAGKVSRTIKDVSICMADYEDGKGNKWENALWHVALPSHPIEPGQNNFTPLPEEYEVLTMSQMVSSSTVDLNKLLTALDKCGISLPSDTTDDNILERLYVAVTQKSEGSGGGDSLGQKPSNSKVETYPIMMSLTQKQVDAILEAKLVDPETGEQFAAAAFDNKEDNTSKLKESLTVMSTMLNDAFKQRYQDRIAALVSTGRATKEYADTVLLPMVDTLDAAQVIQMSQNKDSKVPSNAVEATLVALEAQPAKEGSKDSTLDSLFMSQPAGSQAVEKPASEQGIIDDSEADSLVEQLLKAN